MGDFIPCSVCGQPANVHLTQISSSEVTKVHFCETCALQNGALPGPLTPIVHALSVLQKTQDTDDEPDTAPSTLPAKVCKKCGLTSKEFEKNRRLGCAACYNTFEEDLLELLPRIQPGAEHNGKMPGGQALKNALGEAISKARAGMTAAIKAEAYEEAARLRDEIRRLENAKVTADEV